MPNWRMALFALLMAPFFLAQATPAYAHATLVGSEPAEGAVLRNPPGRIVLTFNEPVSPFVLALVQPNGATLPLTVYRQEGRSLIVESLPELGQGTHLVSWRVASADGHPVGGSLLFSVGAASAAPPQAAPYDTQVRIALWLAKILIYAGLFFGAGGAFALAWDFAAPGRGQGFVAAATLIGLAALPAVLVLQGYDALGAPLGGIGFATAIEAGAATSFVWTVIVAAIALGVTALCLISPKADGRWMSMLALMATGAALAASGHASAAQPQWLTRPLVFLHGTGVAFWIGGLAPLGLSLRDRSEAAPMALARFSKAIPVVVGVVVLTGLALAVLQVDRPASLLSTDYGRLLCAKLALVAVLLALAAINRWRLTQPALAGSAAHAAGLARSIAAETVIVVAILAVVAGWRFTPPPRALAEIAARPVSMHIHTEPAMVDLTFAPGHVGAVSASIVIMTGDFGPIDAKAVSLTLSRPEAGVQPITANAYKPGDGTWRVDDLDIPLAGRWRIGVNIQVSDTDTRKVDGEIDIRP